MKLRIALVLTAGLLATSSAMANPELIRSKNCVACHAVATKIIGPSFADIASRYAYLPGAPEKLAKKIVQGGSGSWGNIPMPASTQVSEAESRALVKWILSLK